MVYFFCLASQAVFFVVHFNAEPNALIDVREDPCTHQTPLNLGFGICRVGFVRGLAKLIGGSMGFGFCLELGARAAGHRPLQPVRVVVLGHGEHGAHAANPIVLQTPYQELNSIELN